MSQDDFYGSNFDMESPNRNRTHKNQERSVKAKCLTWRREPQYPNTILLDFCHKQPLCCINRVNPSNNPSWGFPGSSAGKESACNSGDFSSIPGLGRSTREGIGYPLQYSWASLVAQLVKRIRLQCGRPGFDPWVGKIPWRRERLPTPVFWPV